MALYSKIIGKGAPLFILHGFLGMGDNWKTLARKIADNNYEVHLIDARNHGRSFHSDEFSYNIMVKDLADYAQKRSIASFVLIGHSMGGKTAMLFSVMFPKMIKKLIIVDIAPRYYPIHHDVILKGLQSVNEIHLASRTEADEILSDFVDDIGTRQFLLKNLYWNDEKKLDFRMNLKILNDKVSVVGEALPDSSSFDGPTLFLKGEKSDYISSDDIKEIRHHFPDSRIDTVRDAGHWLHAENPNEFLKLLLAFITI